MKNEETRTNVIVKTGRDHYRTTITANGHTLIADEPENLGGKNEGIDPESLLLASLGSCTTITLRMYADRKKWPLESVKIELNMEVVQSDNQQTTFIKKHMHFEGPLTDDQKTRLVHIADLCPLHKMLNNPIVITTNVL